MSGSNIALDTNEAIAVLNNAGDAGLEIDDRITLSLSTESAALKTAIEAFADYIRQETLALKMTTTPLEGKTAYAEVKIGGEPVRIEVTRP